MFNTIKTLREQNNYSQTAIASYLKISRQMYVKYENGEVDPPVKVISQLCTLYKVPYDVIIEDKLVSEKSDNQHAAIPHKNKTISSYEILEEQIKSLKEYQQQAVMAFIKYLKQECSPHENSKDTFFSLAGKIDLDADELREFREKSPL